MRSRNVSKFLAVLLAASMAFPSVPAYAVGNMAEESGKVESSQEESLQPEAQAAEGQQPEVQDAETLPQAEEGVALQGKNVALKATAGADYTNSGTDVKWVNNGYLATVAGTTWNTWKEAGDLAYPTPVWLEWKEAYTLSGMRVIWWADSANISGEDSVTFPKSCDVEYLNEAGEWVKVTGMVNESGETVDTVGVLYNSSDGNGLNGSNKQWNTVKFPEPIKTTKLRLLVDRNGTKKNGVGISEWEVYGESESQTGPSIAEGLNIAPQATPMAEYSNTDTSVSNVNDQKLGGNSSNTSWNTWKNGGGLDYPYPITLTWDEPYDFSSMRVMWWADDAEAGTASGDGVLYPESCTVWYFDYGKNDWVQVTDMKNEAGEAVSGVGVKGNGTLENNREWNGVLFHTPVKTTKLQLRINRPANATTNAGIGIGEWEVYGEKVENELVSAQITGKSDLVTSETSTYYAMPVPNTLEGDFTYAWSIPEESKEILGIVGAADQKEVSVKALKEGTASINLALSCVMNGAIETRQATYEVVVEKLEGIKEYVTTTTPGKAPILPDSVVAEGITFDDPTPSLKSTTKPDFDFGETFDSKLVPVEWDPIPEAEYQTEGHTFEVTGKAMNSDIKAVAKVTVKKAAEAAEKNTTVTFENVKLTDDFWLPKQKVNALNSLNKAIYQIGQASGGEPNFDNAIKKLNGEPYSAFSGLVFQDTDIYKTLEAISYTLSVLEGDELDAEMTAQKKKLEETLERWITKIEKVQYADGYINTHFTLRSQGYEGGRVPGTHRWRNFSNHEMYNAGHFLESVVAYTRYREGIGKPDYRLYVAGRRFADHIVERFGPNGSRHEVPGHEEVELALVKFAKLAEEYEGVGAGDKYVKTAKTLIDRRGEDYKLRESGYRGYQDGVREYSQDAKPFVEETNAVGHAVRAAYLYTGATDVARLLPESDSDKAKYLNILDTIWDSVANRKTYITGGIGVASHGEDFGGDYELPNNDSYNEICASIALTNWNQRMNLVHEDAKYADVMERALYNGILVGTNLQGNKFYYANKLEIPKKGGSTDGGMYGGVQRQDWFNCACCPPNLMRTIAKLSEYMYTVHKDQIYVNLYIGSDGSMNVDGTKVELNQDTEYPWKGLVGITVNPEQTKAFTINLRIPSWVKEQKNHKVEIKVGDEVVSGKESNGYFAITREWKKGDVITINMPMEIRKTETHPKITTNEGKIALERGPIVYAIEKAGNAQLNKDAVAESDFDPRNFVIPRDSELTANPNADLLNGVVEINGDITYKKSDGEIIPAKLQAVPFYASNNRGDGAEYDPNNPNVKSTRMTVWTNASGAAPVRHTVKLDANGGAVTEESRSILDGGIMGQLPTPERKYHTFQGWYTEREGGQEVTQDTAVTADMTIYAHWKKDETVKLYTVTLDANGGKVTPSVLDMEAGKAIGQLPTPAKTGSKFLGWYTEKENGEKFAETVVVTENITIYAHWEDPDVLFSASGNQTNVGADNSYLIAMTGDRTTEGDNRAAAFIQGETSTGGNPLGSTRVGILAFKLTDAWKKLDPDKMKATVTIDVTDINHELGDNKTKAGLFAVDQDLNDINLTDATTFPAKGNDYSKQATVFSKEWIAKTDLGKKTFDVTEMVKAVLKDPSATHAMFRLQTVTSGFLVIKSGQNAPTLTIEDTGAQQPEKSEGSLTISCAGFAYDGTAKAAPKVESTTNTGAAVTYKYYSDAACTKEIASPSKAGTYYVKGFAEATETHKAAVSEAVSFTIGKAEGSLTIRCAGFTYDGTAKAAPEVESTTNTGAAVTYKYYSDAACTKEIASPSKAGIYYVKGTVVETETYKAAVSAAVKFTIGQKKVTKATFAGFKSVVYYTGKPITQAKLKVKDAETGNLYKEGTDYTLAYSNNKKVGKAKVTIKFKGNYTGSIAKTYEIKKQIPVKGKIYKSGSCRYKVTKSAAKGGTVELYGPLKKTCTSISVPSSVKLNGYTFKVTGIGANAFKNCKKLTKVTVGANVTKIGKGAFQSCAKLKKIVLKTKKLSSVGKNALKGIHAKATIQVPKAKKAAYKKLLKGKGQKKTVAVK